MAKAHNSKLVEARRKARELATAQQERHEKLLTLAEEYFVAADDADSVVAAAREAAAKLIKNAEAQSEAKRAEAQKVIASMVGTGASVADVASRLDLSAALVRAAVKASEPFTPKMADAAPATDSGKSDDAAEQHNEHHHGDAA